MTQDTNGELTIEVYEFKTKKEGRLTRNMRDSPYRISFENVKKHMRDYERYMEADNVLREKIEYRNNLENFINRMKYTIEYDQTTAPLIDPTDKLSIRYALKGADDWLSGMELQGKEVYKAF